MLVASRDALDTMAQYQYGQYYAMLEIKNTVEFSVKQPAGLELFKAEPVQQVIQKSVTSLV